MAETIAHDIGRVVGLCLDPIAWAITFGVGLAMRKVVQVNAQSSRFLIFCSGAAIAGILFMLLIARAFSSTHMEACSEQTFYRVYCPCGVGCLGRSLT